MRVAIVGCGRAGAQHSAAIAVAGGHVVAVCDVEPRNASNLSSTTHAPTCTMPELLADPTVEVIAICTPPDSHLVLGLQVLGAGKAAVIEKPPALSRKDVDELAAASQKHQRPLAVMFQHRGRLPDEALATAWSASASATVEVFRHRPATHYIQDNWRGDLRCSGGGFFAHLAIHYADLVCQVLGEPENVDAVVAEGQLTGIDVRTAMLIRMASGALLTVNASSLPVAHQERLHIRDGTRTLTITSDETHYAEDGREYKVPAPLTSDLRASVYREVHAALRNDAHVCRFGLGTSAGSILLMEHVTNAMSCTL
jgi:predicted dehydrogenase